MCESSTYRAILEEGMLQGKRRALLLLGTHRFGTPDAATHAAIQAVHDLERLDAMALRVLDATGWDEVLATN